MHTETIAAIAASADSLWQVQYSASGKVAMYRNRITGACAAIVHECGAYRLTMAGHSALHGSHDSALQMLRREAAARWTKRRSVA